MLVGAANSRGLDCVRNMFQHGAHVTIRRRQEVAVAFRWVEGVVEFVAIGLEYVSRDGIMFFRTGHAETTRDRTALQIRELARRHREIVICVVHHDVTRGVRDESTLLIPLERMVDQIRGNEEDIAEELWYLTSAIVVRPDPKRVSQHARTHGVGKHVDAFRAGILLLILVTAPPVELAEKPCKGTPALVGSLLIVPVVIQDGHGRVVVAGPDQRYNLYQSTVDDRLVDEGFEKLRTREDFPLPDVVEPVDVEQNLVGALGSLQLREKGFAPDFRIVVGRGTSTEEQVLADARILEIECNLASRLSSD